MSRTQVEIKSEHLDEIKKVIKYSVFFNSPEEYLDHVLDELLLSPSESLEQKNESENLEKRLRDLGYL